MNVFLSLLCHIDFLVVILKGKRDFIDLFVCFLNQVKQSREPQQYSRGPQGDLRVFIIIIYKVFLKYN